MNRRFGRYGAHARYFSKAFGSCHCSSIQLDCALIPVKTNELLLNIAKPNETPFLAPTESVSSPKRLPRPAGNPSARYPGCGSNAHPQLELNALTRGVEGDMFPHTGGPASRFATDAARVPPGQRSAPSASRFAELGESVQPFLSRHRAGARGTRYNFLLSSGG